jgi:hypothetical protein
MLNFYRSDGHLFVTLSGEDGGSGVYLTESQLRK